MLFDTLFDRLVSRLRRSKHQRDDPTSVLDHGDIGSPKPNVNQQKAGSFHGAHDFVVNDLSMGNSVRYQITQNFAAGNPGVDPVLERIATYADLDATMDSSARYPPPLCHPGTRLKIGEKLFNWLANPDREWDMQWLHGPAGTGKSAVSQTFAERCNKTNRLGASFFFSRLYSRNNPDTVVPSLVYQLAVCNPEYKSLVAAQLANDPELLRRKTRRTQFTKLIVEPFSSLQTQGRQSVREPLLVVLDGLDECEGENAQRDIIEMVSEVVQLKKNFPIVWLICSRPEAHLKYIFSRADFTVNCGREELAIDAESIADVNFYLRDGLAGIKAEYQDVTNPTWPSEDQIAVLSGKASGHFGFASISLRYIGDPTFASPMTQFDALLSFLSGVKAGSDNPLQALDALYTGILCDVSGRDLLTVNLLLGYKLHFSGSHLPSVQKLCNFLHIDQMTFYKAFRKLHSVVNVPSPKAALEAQLEPYHLSFEDYLRDPDRSGKFAIEKHSASLQHSKLYLSWYKVDLELFHAADGLIFNGPHKHGVLPDLKWISDNNTEEISCSIAEHVTEWCWWSCGSSIEWDEALLSQIRDFDFRYIQKEKFGQDLREVVNELWKKSSDGFVRTEPQGEIDLRLLRNMEFVIKSWWTSRPATFPLALREDGHGGDYFFLGHGTKAIVCWTTGFPLYRPEVGLPNFGMLNDNNAPTEKQISDYHAWLVEGGAAKGDGVVVNWKN